MSPRQFSSGFCPLYATFFLMTQERQQQMTHTLFYCERIFSSCQSQQQSVARRKTLFPKLAARQTWKPSRWAEALVEPANPRKPRMQTESAFKRKGD